jgi:hypothetical protein
MRFVPISSLLIALLLMFVKSAAGARLLSKVAENMIFFR